MAKHKPREDQQNLPGTDVKNDRVHRAAKQYAKLRDERIAANEAEHDAHEKLMEVMTEEGLDSYSYGDVDVTVTSKRKAKVVVGGQDSPSGKDTDGEDE